MAVAGEGMSLRRDGGPDSFSGAPRGLGALLINRSGIESIGRTTKQPKKDEIS